MRYWNYEPVIFKDLNYVSEIDNTVKRLEERILEGKAKIYNPEKYILVPKENRVIYVSPDGERRTI